MHLNPILTKLSRNNELPSELNLQETMQLRLRATEDLLHIDTEIERLMAKREQVQRSLDIYNIILSPARRLLPDILREIFYHCIVRTYPILSAMEAPMVLTRVCSLWRSVALSSPRIWTRLHIPLPGNPRVSSNNMMSNSGTLELREKLSKTMALRCQAVKEWLDRSGSCPLLLSIAHPDEYSTHVGGNRGEEEDDVAGPLFQVIHPYAPRWAHLRLSMPLRIYQKLEKKIPLDRLSRLQSFTGNISSPGLSPGAASTPTPLHIIELPSLKKLSLNCLQLTINLGRYQNSWNRLTNIRFESPVTDTDFLELLRQCRNLVILDVNVQVPWLRPESLEPNLAMVLLPHLESLKLRESGESSPAIFAVNAPSLKLLQYRCPPRYHNTFELRLLRPEELIWLISNAAASLETLSIEPQAFEPQDVLECLRLAVHVKDLTFGDNFLFGPDSQEGIHYHDFFDLETFTVPTTEYESSTTSSMPLQTEFLLPKLESLQVNDGYIIGDDKMRKILTSRIDAAQRRLTSPLRYVKIQFWRQKEHDIVPEIVARARDVGIEMKLDLVYRPSGSPSVGPLLPSFLLPDH